MSLGDPSIDGRFVLGHDLADLMEGQEAIVWRYGGRMVHDAAPFFASS